MESDDGRGQSIAQCALRPAGCTGSGAWSLSNCDLNRARHPVQSARIGRARRQLPGRWSPRTAAPPRRSKERQAAPLATTSTVRLWSPGPSTSTSHRPRSSAIQVAGRMSSAELGPSTTMDLGDGDLGHRRPAHRAAKVVQVDPTGEMVPDHLRSGVDVEAAVVRPVGNTTTFAAKRSPPTWLHSQVSCRPALGEGSRHRSTPDGAAGVVHPVGADQQHRAGEVVGSGALRCPAVRRPRPADPPPAASCPSASRRPPAPPPSGELPG